MIELHLKDVWAKFAVQKKTGRHAMEALHVDDDDDEWHMLY